MHWARWGDPAEAAPLPEAARGLVELAFGPVVEHPTTPLDEVAAAAAGARRRRCSTSCATCSATGTCTPTTRPGSGTPAASPPPTCCGCVPATASDAPDVVVRPADHDEVAALVAWCSEHRVALVPFGGGTSVVGGLVGAAGGVRRRGLARPGPARPARLGGHRVRDGRAPGRRAGTTRRVAARRARPDARALPPVVRVRVDRRLRGHPVQRPGLLRLRPLRRARHGSHGRDPARHPRARQRPRQRRRPRPA